MAKGEGLSVVSTTRLNRWCASSQPLLDIWWERRNLMGLLRDSMDSQALVMRLRGRSMDQIRKQQNLKSGCEGLTVKRLGRCMRYKTVGPL